MENSTPKDAESTQFPESTDRTKSIVRQTGAVESAAVAIAVVAVQYLQDSAFREVATVLAPVLALQIGRFFAWRIELLAEDFRRRRNKREIFQEKEVAKEEIAFINNKYESTLKRYTDRQQHLLEEINKTGDEALKAQLRAEYEEVKMQVNEIETLIRTEIAAIKVNLER